MSRLYLTRQESRTNSHAYAMLNGTNLLTTYAMELQSYDVGTPEPMIKLIEVPGKPGKLDATLALNGKVNYISRKVSATFHIRDITQDAWLTLLSSLYKLYAGTESKLVFSNDPNWYYKGRFTVSGSKSNPVTGTITIECENAFPYKLESVTVEQSISSSGYVYCTGKDFNGAVTIYASVAMSVTFSGTTYQLSAGNNYIPEIHFSSGSNSLRFVGTGTVRVTYERGIL